MLNLIKHEPDIDKIYLYSKDPYEAKYRLLINIRESAGLKYFHDFSEYSNDMDDIHKNIEEYNPNKQRKILIAFDDMIAYMLGNKKHNAVVTELFIRGRKLNIYLVIITQSYLAVLKNIRLNSANCFVMEIPNKRELQQTTFNHISDIGFQDFMNLYKTCTAKSYSFLVIDTTLAFDNSSRFRKSLLERI